jgi:glycerophosphoryl diester phosphodiesterase
MNAESVNLWHRTIAQEFIDKAHNRGLAVLAFTVNASDELLALAHMGVDGIFTDYYSESASLLAPYIDPCS